MSAIYKHKPVLGLLEIFDAAQNSKNTHGRLINQLFSIYQKGSQRHFTLEYIQCLCICFGNEKQLGVANALDFASKYFAFHAQNVAASQDDFVLAVYKFLFQHHSGEQLKRVRVCQFINKLLISMSDDAEIDEEIFQLLSNAMLERLQDKVASVRVQAVTALHRLQEPFKDNCSVIKALKYHLENDPSPEVRSKVLSLIAITQSTLPVILTRKDDKIASVRTEFYKAMSKIKLVRFTLKQRQEIVRSGFRERAEIVREFIEGYLVSSWFQSFNNDYIKFLDCFDVETFGEVSQKLLFCMFKQQSVSELLEFMKNQQVKGQNVVHLEAINSEIAVFWRCVVTFLMSPPDGNTPADEDSALQIVPELTPFTKYIREYLTTTGHLTKQKEFIVSQLLEIASTYWLSDEVGRGHLKQLCIDLLLNGNLSVSVVPIIVKVLSKTLPSVKERLVTMAEIISDIRDPLNAGHPNQTRLCEAQTSNANIEKDLELIESKLFELSTTKVDVIFEEDASKSDPNTLIKCLMIVIEFLQSRQILKLDEVLLTMKNHFIAHCLQSKNSMVVSLAVNVLDLMCLRSLNLAKDKFYTFLLLIYDGSIQIPPLQALLNILINYGFEAFPIEADLSMSNIRDSNAWPAIEDFMNDDSLPTLYIKHLVAQLSNFLESPNIEVKIITCHGFIKLFVCGRLKSPLIMAQLVLLWYSPISEGEPLIRQPLGLFFANCSSCCPDAPDIICRTLVPIVDVLSRSSSSASSYYKIEAEPVINVLIGLLRHDVLPPESNLSKCGASYHLKVAEIFCNEIILRGVDNVGIYCRMFHKFTLLPSDAKFASKLQAKLKKVLQFKKRMDKRTFSILKTFLDKLDRLMDMESENKTENDIQTDGNDYSTSTIFNNKDDFFSSTRNQNEIGAHIKNEKVEQNCDIVKRTKRKSYQTDEDENTDSTTSENNSGDHDTTIIEGAEMIITSDRDRIIVPGTPDSDVSELAASLARSLRTSKSANTKIVVSESESSSEDEHRNEKRKSTPEDESLSRKKIAIEISNSESNSSSSSSEKEQQEVQRTVRENNEPPISDVKEIIELPDSDSSGFSPPKVEETGDQQVVTSQEDGVISGRGQSLRSARLRQVTALSECDSSSSVEVVKSELTAAENRDRPSEISRQTRSTAKRTRHTRGSYKVRK